MANNISNKYFNRQEIFVQSPMMSLVRFLRAVLSEFVLIVELNFRNKEKRGDGLPISRAILYLFYSGKK